ncbi:MAG: DinB family protein [Acidobacteria bacterium]|nr:DinB family protein [Acidobacteriota bacterium]
MNSEYYSRMFVYDHWANRECMRAIGASGGAVAGTCLGRLAHILSAEKLWLERLRRQPQSMAVWPASTLAECAALAEEMASAWHDYLAELEPARFDERIDYCNSKGEAWSSRVEDVLTHVLMHSAYHRGQIAVEMRAAGAEPPYTDFIHAARQRFMD